MIRMGEDTAHEINPTALPRQRSHPNHLQKEIFLPIFAEVKEKFTTGQKSKGQKPASGESGTHLKLISGKSPGFLPV